MKNSVDYCVNIMLTVSYGGPISCIHTHTHIMTISRTHAHTKARKDAGGRRMHKQDSSVGTLTMLGAELSEVRFLLKIVQIVSGTHSASYAMGTGVVSG